MAEYNSADAFNTISKSCQTVLMGCKWLVNMVVKEEDCSPAIDNIIQNSSAVFAFVHSYTFVATSQVLPGSSRLYHEIIAQTSRGLKTHLVAMFRIAVAINMSLNCGDISLKNLHRQNLDEVIKLAVGAIRKLCYAIKRDPHIVIEMPDPLVLAKSAVIMLRNWVDLFTEGNSLEAVQRPEWKKSFVDRKTNLVEALTSLQSTLMNSAYDLNTDVQDLSNLMKRSITLGDALARNPINSQCRKQVESTVFEGLDLVRRVLPYLRREASGVPENPTGSLAAAEPIVAKDTEIPEPEFDEADAGEEDLTSTVRLNALDRLSIRVRSGSEPSNTPDPAPAPASLSQPTTPDTLSQPATLAPSSHPFNNPSPIYTHMPGPSSGNPPTQATQPAQPTLIKHHPKSTSTSLLRQVRPEDLTSRTVDSHKKKPHSALDLFRSENRLLHEPDAKKENPPIIVPDTTPLPPRSPTLEIPYTPPPLRYAFSEKKKEEVADLETSPSFDDILVMLQDDNERLAAEQEPASESLQALDEASKSPISSTSPKSPISPISPRASISTTPAREDEAKLTTALSSYASVDLPQVVPCKEYVLEKNGKDSKRYTTNFAINLETPENYFGYYSEHFYGNEHLNYVGNVRDLGGPVAISITKFVDPNTKKYMAVIRTRTGDTRLLLQAKSPKPKDLYAALLRAIAPAAVKSKNLTLVTDRNLQNSLLKFEKSQLLTCFKIAVLYAGPQQTQETEFYSNTKHSADFEEFLNFLGERIELKDWKGFRAGLDVRTGTTGTHSVFTKFMELSIMFHVSTFLPYNPLDEQQIERKRHLGNDIVMIIFQEGDQPFSPDAVTSEFNQIFFVVRKIATDDGSTSYQLSIVSHDLISPFGPMIPDPPIFKKSTFFRRWLLTKLINSESAAYAAPAIALKLNRARGELLDMIYKEFCHK